MTDESDPRAELRAAIDDLTDEQARTLLGWTGAFHREREVRDEIHPMGALGEMFGIVSEIQEPGHVRLRLDVDPAWHNPFGVLHGGVVYMLVDSSMGGAVMRGLGEGEFCTTIEVKISYLQSVRKGTLTVETEVVKQGRNIAFTESKVTDQDGRLVATGSGSLIILRPE